MTSPFAVDGRIGLALTVEQTASRAVMKERVEADTGLYVYGRAQGDLTTALWCTMADGGTVRSMISANVEGGEQVVVAAGSVTSANFAWFQASGVIHGVTSTNFGGVTTARFFAAHTGLVSNISTNQSNANVMLPLVLMDASTAGSATFRSIGEIFGTKDLRG